MEIIHVGDLAKVTRKRAFHRAYSAMIEVEEIEYRGNGYVSLSGPRVRQSDRAKLSNVARCSLRYGYFYVRAEEVSLVARAA